MYFRNRLTNSLSYLGFVVTKNNYPACVEHEERMAECELVDIDCAESQSKQCSYGDIEVTLHSCDCDSWVYGAVCEAGISDSLETIESGTECGEWF